MTERDRQRDRQRQSKRERERERERERLGGRERESVTLNLSQYHQTLSPVSISNTGGWNARSEISTLYSLVKNTVSQFSIFKVLFLVKAFINVLHVLSQCMVNSYISKYQECLTIQMFKIHMHAIYSFIIIYL